MGGPRVIVAELEARRSSFSSAFLRASLQMRKPQHQNRRLENIYHVLTSKRLFENESKCLLSACTHVTDLMALHHDVVICPYRTAREEIETGIVVGAGDIGLLVTGGREVCGRREEAAAYGICEGRIDCYARMGKMIRRAQRATVREIQEAIMKQSRYAGFRPGFAEIWVALRRIREVNNSSPCYIEY
ncbi:hypothetical protein M5K25_018798 [Dendrobium thyrsiflorum]|uniref:Uncharacterized protein n=1 Tax=Dendrobium thyrsiflorum TaxID=117978 RepID=A0ABD0UK34_DENTH